MGRRDMNLYNGRPNRNKRYVPNVRYILDRLNKQEEKMKEKRKVGVWQGEELKQMLKEGEMTVQGDKDIFEEMGKEDPQEIYKDDLEGIEVGPKCPTCDLNTQYNNGVEECPVHGPVVIEN